MYIFDVLDLFFIFFFIFLQDDLILDLKKFINFRFKIL